MNKMHPERLLTDTILQRPWQIQLGDRDLSLRSPSLGIVLLSSALIAEAGWQVGESAEDIAPEAMLFAHSNPHITARYIAYHLASGRDEAESARFIEDNARELVESLSPEDLTTLFVMLLEREPVQEIIQAFGIAEDLEARAEAIRSRGNEGWLSFGGRSIYGALIDPVAERYGWTLDYILWGISYANLRLLIADQPTNIYQGEGKGSERLIRADDPSREGELQRLFGA